jgi:type IV secretion system protein VirD4
MGSLIVGWEFEERSAGSSAHTNADILAFSRWKSLGDLAQSVSNRPQEYRPVKYDHDAHIFTVAPTGSGKGVGVIIPTLLSYDGPIIVIDPKGENFKVTAEYRRKIGQKVLVLDPFGVSTPSEIEGEPVMSATLNPLDLALMDDNVDIGLQAQWIAELLSAGKTGGRDPFWDLAAKGLVAGLFDIEINKAKREGRKASFCSVVSALFSADLRDTVQASVELEGISEFALYSLNAYLGAAAPATHSSISSVARGYFLPFLASDVQKSLDNSTIRLEDVRHGVAQTIYIIIPSSKLESHSALLRLWVDTLLNAILSRSSKHEKRTLALLDECANLGELPVLRKAVTLMRGYGLQVWMFFQDVSQLIALYPNDWQTMINNCGMFQTFGNTYALQGADLGKIIPGLENERILEIGRDTQILSIGRKGTIFARKLNYLTDKYFEDRAKPNPFFESKAVDEESSPPELRVII